MRAIILGLALSACGGPSLSVGSIGELEPETRQAVEHWQSALTAAPCVVDLRWANADPDIMVRRGPGPEERASYKDDEIQVGGRVEERFVAMAISHEIGHALGIEEHSTNPDDLMYAEPKRTSPMPTERDVARLCR